MNTNMGKESGNLTPKGAILPDGEILAERFKIEKFMGVEIIGESYLAFDQQEERDIAITIIPPKFCRRTNVIEKIKSEITAASKISHRNILRCFGMGNLSNGSIYITTEYIEGQKLYSILQKRRENGKLFSLRGAFNIVSHLCNGMEEIHKARIHGSLSPFSIRISKTGRVKIADLPLSKLYYLLPIMRKEIPSYVQSFWSPEVKKVGSIVTERSDIYSMGVILFELLTSTLPEDGNMSVKEIRKELPEEIDEILARCLDPDPYARWNNSSALKNALSKVVEKFEVDEKEATSYSDDMQIDLEIDIEKPMMKPPPPPPPLQKRKTASSPPSVQTGGQAQAKKEPPPQKHLSAKSPRSHASKLDLDTLLSTFTDQDAEKWMITKDGMDHGPFTTREVIQMITRWEVEGHHIIQDIEKGIRVKLRDSEEFKDIVERAKIEKQRKEELEALKKSERAEKRGGIFKFLVIVAIVGGVGVLVGGYFLTRAAVGHFTSAGKEVDLSEGQIKIDLGKGGILKEKRRGKGRRRKGVRGRRGGNLSYEEYMAQGVELGNLTSDGGQMQLTQSQINSVMSTQGRKLYPCIYAELKRNPNLKRVSLKFAIEGKSGSVKAITVTSGGSNEFKACIASKMKQIRFPTFSAPRMGATFYFDVGR